MGDNTERRIAVCKSGVARIYNMLQYSSTEWESYLSLAQSITASLDRTPFMESQDRAEDQVWMIEGLQRLAYHDADSGGVQSLADWCQRQWLRILEHDPSRSKVLEGMCYISPRVHLYLRSLLVPFESNNLSRPWTQLVAQSTDPPLIHSSRRR